MMAASETTVLQVIAFLQNVLPPDTPPLSADTQLFGTGLLDSLSIVHLIVWVEEQTGQALDPQTFNLRDEWAVVADVARFVDRKLRS